MNNNRSNVENSKIAEVLSFFNLGTPTKVVPITNGLGNHSYIVTTSQIDFVVKFLVTQKTVGIENDVAIQQQLNQINIRTPIYIANNSGQYVYTNELLQAVISKKIEGVTPEFANKNLAYAIGKTLALFHKFVIALPHPLKGWMDPGIYDINTEESRALFSVSLPKGITHGDMHLENVLVNPKKPGNILAVIDFEEVGEDLFLIDLTRSILGVCHSEDGNSLVPELVDAEIQGYESVRKLTQSEKVLFPQAMKYTTDVCIKWFIDHGYERYVEEHRRRVKSFKMPNMD